VTGIVAAQTAGSTPDATSTQESTGTPGGGDANTPDASDESTDRETHRDAYLDALAENLGVSREALDGALSQTALDMVDQALADGRITQDEADRIKERINSGEGPFFGGPGFGFGHGFGKGFAHGVHVGVTLEDLAGFLGVDVSVIREGLQNEQTLAEIAEANGKTRDELIDHLVANVEEHLDAMVADGTITQDEADEKLANARERIGELVDSMGPLFSGPRHFGRPMGPGGPGRFERWNDDGQDTDASTPNTETSGLTL
jgi:uncharacterized protein YidB (DUF937 family)